MIKYDKYFLRITSPDNQLKTYFDNVKQRAYNANVPEFILTLETYQVLNEQNNPQQKKKNRFVWLQLQGIQH